MLKFKYLLNESPPQPHNKTEVDAKFDQERLYSLSIVMMKYFFKSYLQL